MVASPDTPPRASALDLLTTEPHVVVDTDRRVFPVPEDEGVPHRVGLRISDFPLVPFHVARAGGVALLRYRVAATLRTLADPPIEEFPFPLPGLGVDVVRNPRQADRHVVAWLREVLREAAAER
ncbi:hypothetical protein [Streptomyces sennicomposti]|uniref:hypothetical protein n=1 Tax=Streptomyces TaxID=1883 RepID=UPI001FFDA8EE|nr:hypothetical protein [Streptomyces sennicomposti]